MAEEKNGFDLTGALVPPDEIFRGGPQKDGIPAINKPKFIPVNKANFLSPEDHILGITISGKSKAYPIKIMNWHEIVNDSIKGAHFAVTYCPLCGTGVAFSSKVKDDQLRFGVSGLLYNSDVLLYDAKTESLWSQIMGKAVSGKMKGTRLKLLPLHQTTWGKWNSEHPDTLVLSTDTGFNRDYTRNPYNGYEKSIKLYFDVSHQSPRKYHPKEKVLGLDAGGVFKAYPFIELNRLKKSQLDEVVNKERYTIVWDKKSQSGKVFNSKGKEMPVLQAFWFAWYTFHPDTLVFSGKDRLE